MVNPHSKWLREQREYVRSQKHKYLTPEYLLPLDAAADALDACEQAFRDICNELADRRAGTAQPVTNAADMARAALYKLEDGK